MSKSTKAILMTFASLSIITGAIVGIAYLSSKPWFPLALVCMILVAIIIFTYRLILDHL